MAKEQENEPAEEKKKPNWRSLQAIMVLLIFLAGTVPLYVGSRILVDSMKSYQVMYRTRQIQSQMRVLTDELENSGYLKGVRSDTLDAELMQVSDLYEGRILAIDQNFQIVMDTYGLHKGKTSISEEVIRAFGGTASSSFSEEENYIQVVLPVYEEGSDVVIGVLMAEVSTQAQHALVSRMEQNERILLAVTAAIALLIAILLSILAVAPFKNVSQEMDKASFGDLKTISPKKRFRETEAMVESYNRLILRLKRTDESRQEFVSNVSHELKTPITSMKVLADSLLEQTEVPPEIYREFFGDIREEIDRESQIIEDLLALVRMDKARQELNVKRVDLNLFLESLLKRLKPLTKQKNLELILETFRPVYGEIDEGKFSLAVSNVIENAIKYNKQDGWVRVTLNADFKYFFIKVEDSGIGIPESAKDHVFERFYRADKARTRGAGKVGGTGLGLSITQELVHIHHGEIRLHSVEGEGTTFTIRVPLIFIP
ncbi:MAG: two-component sensor histidine kinase [Lachnospiraceae bacterium]|nr:two-component sensor histidine kinase [Lachnospiraceae bacterium]